MFVLKKYFYTSQREKSSSFENNPKNQTNNKTDLILKSNKH